MPPEHRQNLNILIVEDDIGLCDALTDILQAEGYHVTCAHSGLDGLARLAERKPDLIITDHMMPHMDGIAMIRMIRSEPKYAELPILLFSAALPADTPGTELANLFKRKPMSMDQLLASVATLLPASQAASPHP